MTPTEKARLINDLIKENRDSTIKDYLETLKEIEQIQQAA